LIDTIFRVFFKTDWVIDKSEFWDSIWVQVIFPCVSVVEDTSFIVVSVVDFAWLNIQEVVAVDEVVSVLEFIVGSVSQWVVGGFFFIYAPVISILSPTVVN
jgi:hypothetical protein